jgi:site-specific recombinase XerC
MCGKGLDGARMTDHAAAMAQYSQPDMPASVRAASAATLRLYARDWTAFETWCAATGQTALPATAATVAAFLAEAAPRLSAGALARRTSAIAARHRQRGFAVPTSDRTVKAVLRTARRSAAPRRAPPPTPAQLLRLATACGGDLSGLRDHALLLLAAAGLGPAALVGLDAEHIRLTAAAAEMTLGAGGRRARDAADQAPGEEEGGRARGDWVIHRSIVRDADRSRCPVQALHDWLQISDTQFGPVFRKIDRWGNIEHRRFSLAAVRQIIRRRTRRRARRAGKATAP